MGPTSEQEDGEIDDPSEQSTGTPMVTLTKIDPKDIPGVSNNFLMRGADRKPTGDKNGGKGSDVDDDNDQRGRARNRSDAKEKPT